MRSHFRKALYATAFALLVALNTQGFGVSGAPNLARTYSSNPSFESKSVPLYWAQARCFPRTTFDTFPPSIIGASNNLCYVANSVGIQGGTVLFESDGQTVNVYARVQIQTSCFWEGINEVGMSQENAYWEIRILGPNGYVPWPHGGVAADLVDSCGQSVWQAYCPDEGPQGLGCKGIDDLQDSSAPNGLYWLGQFPLTQSGQYHLEVRAVICCNDGSDNGWGNNPSRFETDWSVSDSVQLNAYQPPPQPQCSGGQVWNGSQCTCPNGQQWNGQQCVAPPPPQPQCSGGQTWNGNQCVCPSGQDWNGQQCVTPPPPPPSTYNCGGRAYPISGLTYVEIWGLPLSYLGQDPAGLNSQDIHAEITVTWCQNGEQQQGTGTTPFQIAADPGSPISFSVVAPSNFACVWDHYGYQQHPNTCTLQITVMQNDKIAAFFQVAQPTLIIQPIDSFTNSAPTDETMTSKSLESSLPI